VSAKDPSAAVGDTTRFDYWYAYRGARDELLQCAKVAALMETRQNIDGTKVALQVSRIRLVEASSAYVSASKALESFDGVAK